jgi:hypothetical protein
MIKVRALKTTSGDYGLLKKGQVGEVRGSVAKELAMRGMAEIIGEDDGREPEPIGGSIRIKENETGKMLMDSKIIIKDDRPSVTGQPVEPEKAEQKKVVEEQEPEKKEQKETPKKQYK